MSSPKYDVLIAGAGPAGASCAYHLSRQGISAALIDKSYFPRDKLCAGGVPVSIGNILPLQNFLKKSISFDKYCFSYKGQKEAFGSIESESVFSIERSSFDSELVHCAFEEGAQFYQGYRVTEIHQDNNYVTVKTDKGKSFLGKVLVGADGGNSLIRWHAGLSRKNNKQNRSGSCGFYRFQAENEFLDKYRTMVHLDFNFLPHGFAGILPKQDYLWIGVYGEGRLSPDKLKSYTDKFIETLGIKGKPGLFRSMNLFLYSGERNLVKERVLLAGEAASLVNPLSGEGIKPAMDSGKIAAEEICLYLKEDRPLTNYNIRIHKEIGKELSFASGFAKIAYTFPDLAFDGMVKTAEDALKILNGTLSYSSFLQRLKRKLLKRMNINL